MATNYTPIVNTADANASTFNAPLNELDAAIEDVKDGTATLATPTISSMTNAQHDHEDAVGGGKLTVDALDSSGIPDGYAVVADGVGGYAHESIPLLPTGVVLPYAGSSTPSGWLLCNGAAVSRTTYATLFAVIGTTYGVGDGSTTFNLPDLRGRIPGGLDNLGGSSANRITDAQADSLGGNMGEEAHTLSATEMPAHNHRLNYYNGAGSGQPITVSGYTFGNNQQFTMTYNVPNAISNNMFMENVGGGNSHNNVQPTLFMNYIIKA